MFDRSLRSFLLFFFVSQPLKQFFVGFASLFANSSSFSSQQTLISVGQNLFQPLSNSVFHFIRAKIENIHPQKMETKSTRKTSSFLVIFLQKCFFFSRKKSTDIFLIAKSNKQTNDKSCFETSLESEMRLSQPTETKFVRFFNLFFH